MSDHHVFCACRICIPDELLSPENVQRRKQLDGEQRPRNRRVWLSEEILLEDRLSPSDLYPGPMIQIGPLDV